MEEGWNTPRLSVHQRRAAVYGLMFGVTLAVLAIQIAPGVTCGEGTFSAGRPFVYTFACRWGGPVAQWSTIDSAALGADGLIWGVIWGAIALAARVAWSLPRITPDSRPAPAARR